MKSWLQSPHWTSQSPYDASKWFEQPIHYLWQSWSFWTTMDEYGIWITGQPATLTLMSVRVSLTMELRLGAVANLNGSDD